MVEDKRQELPKDVMSVRELSQYLGIGKSKIYTLIKQKKIPASKIGRQYKFRKDLIDQWLKEQTIIKKEEPQMKLFEEKEKSET